MENDFASCPRTAECSYLPVSFGRLPAADTHAPVCRGDDQFLFSSATFANEHNPSGAISPP